MSRLDCAVGAGCVAFLFTASVEAQTATGKTLGSMGCGSDMREVRGEPGLSQRNLRSHPGSGGPRLRPRLEHNQTHEALLRAHLLNRWPTPSTVSVA